MGPWRLLAVLRRKWMSKQVYFLMQKRKRARSLKDPYDDHSYVALG